MEYIVPIAITVYLVVSIIGAVVKSLSTGSPTQPPVRRAGSELPEESRRTTLEPESGSEGEATVLPQQTAGRPAQGSASWFELPELEIPAFGPHQQRSEEEDVSTTESDAEDFESGSTLEPDESMEKDREFGSSGDELEDFEEFDELEETTDDRTVRAKDSRDRPASVQISWDLTKTELRRAVVFREVLGPPRAKRPWPS